MTATPCQSAPSSASSPPAMPVRRVDAREGPAGRRLRITASIAVLAAALPLAGCINVPVPAEPVAATPPTPPTPIALAGMRRPAAAAPAPAGGTGAGPGAVVAASRLDGLLQGASLRVCTPGDYRPFSFWPEGSPPEGIDAELVQSMAGGLGNRIEWVRTRWADLLNDLNAQRCDLVVGGVSVTLERQRQAFFSTAYMINGKVPIVRCADAGRYTSIAAIDQPGTRVIFNPGGSNERFARAHFSHATLAQHAENTTIFDELLQQRADVFVTEGAEAIIQQRLRPGLCAVNPERPLEYGEMAWMLPRDDMAWKLYVDQWLRQAQQTGLLGATIDRWLR